jgi:two-component system LytT family response regulator
VAHKIAIPDRQGVTFVELDDIIRCRADRNYTTFFLNNGEKILSSRPLNDYEMLLAGHNFLRVHNSHLVNMSHISRYIKGEPGIAVMTDKSEVEISRRKKGELLGRLALWPAVRP